MNIDATKMPRPRIHPGEILRSEFMEPRGLSQALLAREIRVSPVRIYQIIHAKRRITADTALRLGEYFGITAQFWMNMQSTYDLETAKRNRPKHRDEPIISG